MESKKPLQITREKHLDHMVRVVPLIAFFYAVQSFLLVKFAPGHFNGFHFGILAAIICAMIGGFVLYDVRHEVFFDEEELRIKFLWYKKSISYQDITSITVGNPDQSFSGLTIKTSKTQTTFYFIDEAEKIKNWIEEKRTPLQNAA